MRTLQCGQHQQQAGWPLARIANGNGNSLATAAVASAAVTAVASRAVAAVDSAVPTELAAQRQSGGVSYDSNGCSGGSGSSGRNGCGSGNGSSDCGRGRHGSSRGGLLGWELRSADEGL